MANKKPDEVSGWKSKLAALDSLPGETQLDKNDRWQQLHSRLQQKQGRKKALWYWAAACVLLLLATLLWTINPQQTKLVSPIAVKQFHEKALLPSASKEAIDTMHVAADLSVKANTKPAHTVPPTQKDTLLGFVQVPQQLTIAETVTVAKVVPNILSADTQLVAATAMPLPAKKKLKVVHVNELDYPAITGPRIYTGQDYSVQQNRFINQPVYSTVSPSTSGIQFTISSTKKVSTN